MVVLQQSWTFGRGETLQAECQVAAGAHTTAELFTSKAQPLATGFLGSAPFLAPNQTRTFPLAAAFDPAQGSLSDTQILLFASDAPGDAPSATVRITVVAF